VNQLSERYLEDFAVGQTFGSGRLRIDGERAGVTIPNSANSLHPALVNAHGSGDGVPVR
jgi:hypothetical protein